MNTPVLPLLVPMTLDEIENEIIRLGLVIQSSPSFTKRAAAMRDIQRLKAIRQQQGEAK